MQWFGAIWAFWSALGAFFRYNYLLLGGLGTKIEWWQLFIWANLLLGIFFVESWALFHLQSTGHTEIMYPLNHQNHYPSASEFLGQTDFDHLISARPEISAAADYFLDDSRRCNFCPPGNVFGH